MGSGNEMRTSGITSRGTADAGQYESGDSRSPQDVEAHSESPLQQAIYALRSDRKKQARAARGTARQRITEREWRIIGLVAKGCTNPGIAIELGTTSNVVRNALKDIFDKLGMWNRTELALWFVSQESS